MSDKKDKANNSNGSDKPDKINDYIKNFSNNESYYSSMRIIALVFFVIVVIIALLFLIFFYFNKKQTKIESLRTPESSSKEDPVQTKCKKKSRKELGDKKYTNDFKVKSNKTVV